MSVYYYLKTKMYNNNNKKEFTSFVGMHPIPLLHGMTIGEYAKMINGEKLLSIDSAKLKVI